MYNVDIVDHSGRAALLTRNDCGGSKGVDGTDDMLWNDHEEDGDVSI
jgi:hypothetical protein